MISLLKKKYSLLALLILITAISCKKKKETVAPVAEVKVETPVVAKKTFDDVNLKQLGEPLMVYENAQYLLSQFITTVLLLTKANKM
jgi:hypothetical protein